MDKNFWEEQLKKLKERDFKFSTLSNIKINPLYTPDDLPDLDYEKDLNYPGGFPFTRGVYPNMYRGRLWTMRQFSGFGTAKDTNNRYKYLLKHGQTGLSVAFDFPTLYGKDSDDPFAHGEVYRCWRKTGCSQRRTYRYNSKRYVERIPGTKNLDLPT
jgi:methylmalonyl-CoA mutase N-terminal domain/subunit